MTAAPLAAPLHLAWSDCRNARDLGGIPTVQGGRIRPGALVRTDGHERLDPAGVRALRAYGVSRILDLRRADECARMPSPFVGDPLYRWLSVCPDETGGDTIASIYCRMLDDRPELFATAVAQVAEAPPGAVVVHCVAGKDRTGLVVGFALQLAGVSPEVIAADYAMSDERLQQTYAEYLAAADPREHDRLRELYQTPARAMHSVLAHLDATYGGVQGYLERGGCTAAHVAALRDRLLEQDP